jgi:hypothetical protein
MSNGTTGFQVAPIAEDEAMKLSTMFSRAADAIVAASTMPQKINDLTSQVERLTQDLEARTLHADELDHTIHELREQRDHFKATAATADHVADERSRQLEAEQRATHELNAKLEALGRDLDLTKADRDDAEYKALELHDELAKAKATIADIQAKVAAFFPSAPTPAAPVPTPEPEPSPVELPKWEDMKAGRPLTEAEQDHFASHSTLPIPEPETTAHVNDPLPEPWEPAKPIRRYVDNWEPGTLWDSGEGRYYHEG